MGLEKDIIEAFFSKLSSKEEIPDTVVEKLRELFNAMEVDEESLLKILKETRQDD